MRKLFLLLCFFSPLAFVLGQEITVLSHNLTFIPKDEVHGFHFIGKGYDLAGKVKIATFRGICSNSGKENLAGMYDKFQESANSFGANSFRVDTASFDSANQSVVVISAYYFYDDELNMVEQQLPSNMVYVIGSLDGDKQKGKKFRFNGEKIVLMPLEYVAHQNQVGEETTISVGGLTGAKCWIKGKTGRLPEHFSLAGFGVGGVSVVTPGQVGIGFNTGRVEKVDLNLGQFLVSVLHQKQAGAALPDDAGAEQE